jgi:hypothetical protein
MKKGGFETSINRSILIMYCLEIEGGSQSRTSANFFMEKGLGFIPNINPSH